jgi:hypothetical protein
MFSHNHTAADTTTTTTTNNTTTTTSASASARLMGGEACFPLAEWRIEGLEPAQAADLGGVLAETVTVRHSNLHFRSCGYVLLFKLFVLF